MYLTICTLAGSSISSLFTQPIESRNLVKLHWKSAKRITQYLKGTSDFGITYAGNKQFILEAYSDASWGCKDNY